MPEVDRAGVEDEAGHRRGERHVARGREIARRRFDLGAVVIHARVRRYGPAKLDLMTRLSIEATA